MSLVIPFNNQPIATEVKTGAFTIPSGQYAKVSVTQFDDDFTIDSDIAIPKMKYTGDVDGSVGNTKVFTNDSQYVLVGNLVAFNPTGSVIAGTVKIAGVNSGNAGITPAESSLLDNTGNEYQFTY